MRWVNILGKDTTRSRWLYISFSLSMMTCRRRKRCRRQQEQRQQQHVSIMIHHSSSSNIWASCLSSGFVLFYFLSDNIFEWIWIGLDSGVIVRLLRWWGLDNNIQNIFTNLTILKFQMICTIFAINHPNKK